MVVKGVMLIKYRHIKNKLKNYIIRRKGDFFV
jgi:hypothetical protein